MAIKEVMGLDGEGHTTRIYFIGLEGYPEHWTADTPGNLPGPGAVYVGAAQKDGEWYGGEWVYDPPLPPQTVEEYLNSIRS